MTKTKLKDIEKALTGRTIKAVILNRWKTGRKHHPITTDPRLMLDDGTVVSFVVQETESEGYGIEIHAHFHDSSGGGKTV